MSMGSFSSEVESFHGFLGDQLAEGPCQETPEELLRLWRQQREEEIARLKDLIAPALEQSRRGESGPLDVEALKQRVRKHIAEVRGEND